MTVISVFLASELFIENIQKYPIISRTGFCLDLELQIFALTLSTLQKVSYFLSIFRALRKFIQDSSSLSNLGSKSAFLVNVAFSARAALCSRGARARFAYTLLRSFFSKICC